MSVSKLSGLQPQRVFHYFEELCGIPHGSGNTKAISDYLVAYAKAHDLRYIQDELNNVILFAPGSAGYEDHSPVILQGHMDMVCQKDEDSNIDFATDGLDVDHDDQWVFAHGTTLGGDNGIAVAYALALLEDKEIPHPPLEVVVTVDEETGMYGAAGIDMSCLQGRMLLNMDSEEEGIFTVSCAGGCRSTLEMKVQRRVIYGPGISLTVDGLQGGHSGAEIHKNRGNANKLMGQLLERILDKMPLCLATLAGGSADNAIPRSCQATMVAMSMDLEQINGIVEEFQAQIRREYNEPEAVVRADNIDSLGGYAVPADTSARIIKLLNMLPNGIQAMSQSMPGLVQTSLNLGVMKLDNEDMKLTFSVRSSVNQEKKALLEVLENIARVSDCSYTQMGDYPAWEYKEESALRDVMVRTYRDMYGCEPQVMSIHAGLECGLLSEKLPGLDCVSMGPNMQDIHTSREKLNIASVERVWNYLLRVLQAL